ncbi:hypothetical protein BGX21_007334, partial [Mortierella sp. AD011]
MTAKLPERYLKYSGELFRDHQTLQSFANALMGLENTVFAFLPTVGGSSHARNDSNSGKQWRAQGANHSPFGGAHFRAEQIRAQVDDSSMDLDNAEIERLCEIAAVETRRIQAGMRCFNCNRTGHQARACTVPSTRGSCFNCGRQGHIARACPFPRNKENRVAPQYILQSYHVEAGEEEDGFEVLNHPVHVVDGRIAGKPVKVLIDSGASGNFVSSSFIKQLHSSDYKTATLPQPVQILLARGQRSTATDR